MLPEIHHIVSSTCTCMHMYMHVSSAQCNIAMRLEPTYSMCVEVYEAWGQEVSVEVLVTGLQER